MARARPAPPQSRALPLAEPCALHGLSAIDRMRRALSRISLAQLAVLCALLAAFAVAMILPLLSLFAQAFQDGAGRFVGLANYRAYFGSPALSRAVWNTIDISLVTAFYSVTLGFLYAYALTRTNIRFKAFFRYVALVPIFIPTVVHALGLIYLLGRQGVLTRLGLQVELYGRLGIILAEIIFTFPQAFLMFFVTLKYADGRLYEAADSMGVKPLTKLWKITLPEVKFTLVNAAFVCFTLAFTDFGAPMVIGGNFNVLATDLHTQITGHFNMSMGAVVGTLLLVPAALAFVVNRVTNISNMGAMSAKSTKLVVRRSPARDAFFFVFCSAIALCLFALVGALALGAFSTLYPFNMTPTLANFRFDVATGGIGSFFNSVKMSLATAAVGTAFVFVYSYMVEKTEGFGFLTKFGKLLSILPLALPGMVIGISYIFFFNNAANPLNFVHGTVAILVMANILSFFSVPFLTATGALKKLDREFESVSDSMGAPRWKLFAFVTMPLSFPAALEVFMYYFVSAMVTISALVFLYTPNFRVASIAIAHMQAAGDFAQAAAMSLLILLINVAARLLYELAMVFIRRRSKRRQA